MSAEAWTGLIALLFAVSGLLTAVAAVISAKRKGHKECEDRIKDLRREAEQAEDALHALRMERFYDDRG